MHILETHRRPADREFRSYGAMRAFVREAQDAADMIRGGSQAVNAYLAPPRMEAEELEDEATEMMPAASSALT